MVYFFLNMNYHNINKRVMLPFKYILNIDKYFLPYTQVLLLIFYRYRKSVTVDGFEV
jgi:hypothetical protein